MAMCGSHWVTTAPPRTVHPRGCPHITDQLGVGKKLNDLFAAANEAMMLSRKEFWDHYSITDI